MSFLHKLEAELELAQTEINRLKERDQQWAELIQLYRLALFKAERGGRVDAEHWQQMTKLKNSLGIGNGILKP